MSFDVTTLALAKSYADQHGSGGGGASTTGDFIIKMTVEDNVDNYTVTSCDATVEQIDAAVANEKRVVVIASYNGIIFELPMLEGIEGNTYYFGMFLQGQVILSFVQKVAENESEWRFGMGQILSGDVGYSNDALPNISSVEDALNKLIPKSHTHSNKAVLDKFSETDGKPIYNGEPIGGENTIYIPATINTSSDPPTIETSATFEQIEAAYNLGREQILKLVAKGSVDFIYMLPLVFAGQGEAFYFEAIIGSQSVFASVTPTNEWGLEFYDITPTPKEEIVNDVLAALPTWTGGSY